MFAFDFVSRGRNRGILSKPQKTNLTCDDIKFAQSEDNKNRFAYGQIIAKNVDHAEKKFEKYFPREKKVFN